MPGRATELWAGRHGIGEIERAAGNIKIGPQHAVIKISMTLKLVMLATPEEARGKKIVASNWSGLMGMCL
jgi:hypothetical protein